MSGPPVARRLLAELPLWHKAAATRIPASFELEWTARCNCDCAHCYVNLPAGDGAAIKREISVGAAGDIADQAVSLGALWCLVTGGEPLLRPDFFELYLALRKKGLLVSVFTNAGLVTREHVELFRRYPPRDVEVTVYGASEETYERVTRRPGSWQAFRRGLDLLLAGGVKVRLKAMAMRSNVHELPAIAGFCRERTKDFYRFDPLLHLRYDGDPRRNAEIRAQRLSPQEIAAIEQADEERAAAVEKGCGGRIGPEISRAGCDHLFHCGAGRKSFAVGHDGSFLLCPSLRHPDCVFDLTRGGLAEAWNGFAPRVLGLRSGDPEFLGRCAPCSLVNLCLWCPAHAHLETGRLDAWCDSFCAAAHARAEAARARKIAAPP